MISITNYIASFASVFPSIEKLMPWHITSQLPETISSLIEKLDSNYLINDNVAVHRTAVVETGVIIKAPAIIHANCFIGAHAYLRGGVILEANVSIGPSVEIKTSIFCSHSAAAHFNFIGDSIIGSHVNIEAGAIIANHHNDRIDKMIRIKVDEDIFETGVIKFGALVGDDCKIGANAVLSPGSILKKQTIIGRLTLY
ncbi:DapH/DapD/GlmU-related protein [Pollutibacter soli]|uniref:DapH/DapD/GlmU-related protein n=1 Tax=Pollutibacter soli TaxID=3034157 RepID=UPI003013EC13